MWIQKIIQLKGNVFKQGNQFNVKECTRQAGRQTSERGANRTKDEKCKMDWEKIINLFICSDFFVLHYSWKRNFELCACVCRLLCFISLPTKRKQKVTPLRVSNSWSKRQEHSAKETSTRDGHTVWWMIDVITWLLKSIFFLIYLCVYGFHEVCRPKSLTR